MDRSASFEIALPGFQVGGLDLADAPRLQRLFDACADYSVFENGAAYPPDAAQTEFATAPPGRTVADKFMFGLIDGEGDTVGLIACDRGWPDAGCWWIALMLVDPAQRGCGVAQAFLAGFVEWVAAQGAGRIELAVLDENERGQRFWRRQGFSHIRGTEPRTIGTKRHILHVLRRDLD